MNFSSYFSFRLAKQSEFMNMDNLIKYLMIT